MCGWCGASAYCWATWCKGWRLADLVAQWSISEASVYNWLHAFLLQGVDSLVYHHGGGRPSRLTPSQKRELCDLLDAGPAGSRV